MWGIFTAEGELQVAQAFDTKREAEKRAEYIESVLNITPLTMKKLDANTTHKDWQ